MPIAFPQFANTGPLDLHGFARDSVWTVVSSSEDCVALELSDSEATRAKWPHAFTLTYTVSLLEQHTLDVNLTVRNTEKEEAWSFTGCLHTYLACNASTVSVDGLSGNKYIDKCDGMKEKVQEEGEWKVTTPHHALSSLWWCHLIVVVR